MGLRLRWLSLRKNNQNQYGFRFIMLAYILYWSNFRLIFRIGFFINRENIIFHLLDLFVLDGKCFGWEIGSVVVQSHRVVSSLDMMDLCAAICKAMHGQIWVRSSCRAVQWSSAVAVFGMHATVAFGQSNCQWRPYGPEIHGLCSFAFLALCNKHQQLALLHQQAPHCLIAV